MSLPEYTDLWPLIQQDIYGVLAADEMIGTRIGVVIEPGDIENVILSKLTKLLGAGKDGKTGIGFMVWPIEQAVDENPNVPGGPLKLTLTIQFAENVTLNRSAKGTGLPLRIFAARAAKLLKLYTPVGFTSSLVPANPVISEFTSNRDAAVRIGQVEFTCFENDDINLQRLARPAISLDNVSLPYTVTLTQPDAAAIYYTLDGSHPHEGNAKAFLYSAPFVVNEAYLLRFRAFGNTGDLKTFPSDTAARTLS